MRPLAIVIPWFGAELKGGAEQQAFQLAARLAARGAEVEVLTTCCRSFQDDWAENHLPPGATSLNNFTVRRFPVDARDRTRFDEVNARLLALAPADLRAGVSPVSVADEQIFIRENINSAALLAHLNARVEDYRAFIFLPYMFGIVAQGLPLVAARAFLQPCLHDEPQAYFRAFEELLRLPRLLLFNSDGERELALRLYGPALLARSLVVGEGIEQAALTDEQLETALPPTLQRAPFVLYLGRRDETKNTPLLLDAFRRFKERAPQSDLQLVLAGPGASSPDARGANHNDTLDLGMVSEELKAALLANCRALFQPSLHESFSRAMMEAWSYGRPVAAHRRCLATSLAVERARGGWLAATADEWADVFAKAATATTDELAATGARGRLYADEHADWEKVIARYENALGLHLGETKKTITHSFNSKTTASGFAHETPQSINSETTPTPSSDFENAPPTSGSSETPTSFKWEMRRTIARAPQQPVHQLLPDIADGDAISNQAIAIRDYLRAGGRDSEIFVKRRDERMTHEAHIFDAAHIPPDAALIYHHSIGSELTAFAVAHAGAKCLVYHNITPATFYAPYRPGFAWMLETGRAHLPRLARHFKCSVGDSAYNAAELAACGFARPTVLPIICDPAKWDLRADEALMSRLQDGATNLLFVGRIAPNKCQHELVAAFALYRELDANSRLIIAGAGRASDPYDALLRRTIEQHKLAAHVHVTGHSTDAELLAYYRTAHLYWTLSEHEGFGVPPVEAMWFDVPVLAYRSAATPETLGEAGMLFDDKDDLREAARLAKLLARDDVNLRQRVIAAGRVRREAFTPVSVEAILDDLIARMDNADERQQIEVA